MNTQALCALIRMGLSSAGCPSCPRSLPSTASPLHSSRLEQPASPLENNCHRIIDEILCNHPSSDQTGARDPSLFFLLLCPPASPALASALWEFASQV